MSDTTSSKSFSQLQDVIQQNIKKVEALPSCHKLLALDYLFPFDQCFSVKGVQGIAGKLHFDPTRVLPSSITKLKKNKKVSTANPNDIPVVFKVSADVNYSIDHEKNILLSLQTLRDWCPHYVGCLGYLSFPVSADFIDAEKQSSSDDDSDEEIRTAEEKRPKPKPGTVSIWSNQGDTLPATMMFLEWIGNTASPDTYSMHHMCRYGSMQQSLSQMIMTLCGLETAQQSLDFVHYDMHLENILLQECDPDLVFVYLYPNPEDSIIVPTLGHYPVMIDMGSSYCNHLVGTAVKTSVSFYSSGLQPTVFDPLNDVHHFLFRCIDRLEMFNHRWRDVGTKFMHIFRHLPLWRYKGWKKLPCNLVKRAVKLIYELVPDLVNNEFWVEYTYEIMDILVAATTIHWKQVDGYQDTEFLNKELEAAMRSFSSHLQILDDHDKFETDEELLLVLRELALLSRHLNRPTASLIKEDESKFKTLINNLVGSLPPKFNINKCTQTIYRLGRIFSHLFSVYLKDNMDMIETAYKNIPIKRPLDAVSVLQRMIPCRYRVQKNTVFRVFDHQQKRTWSISASELNVRSGKPLELTPKVKREILQFIRTQQMN